MDMKPMRRKDREMDEAFALKVLDDCEYGTLATINEDGSPYCIPISPVRSGKDVYIHFGPGGQKVENMQRDPRVCLSCVSWTNIPEGMFTTEYESCVLYGRLEIVDDKEEKIQALKLLCEKLTPGNMANFGEAIEMSIGRTAIGKIHIEHITGKRKKYDSEGKEMKFGRME